MNNSNYFQDKMQLPDRKSIRLRQHDYSGGEYFVTICTKYKQHFLGSIREGQMYLSAIGKIADNAIKEVSHHCPYACITEYVVMPNHIHLIVEIQRGHASLPVSRPALAVVVGMFKQHVVSMARLKGLEFGWQSRYHDHIIRNDMDSMTIRKYIRNNIAVWDSDCFYNADIHPDK